MQQLKSMRKNVSLMYIQVINLFRCRLPSIVIACNIDVNTIGHLLFAYLYYIILMICTDARSSTVSIPNATTLASD